MTEQEKDTIRHNLAMAQHELANLKEKQIKITAELLANAGRIESAIIWIEQAQVQINKDLK